MRDNLKPSERNIITEMTDIVQEIEALLREANILSVYVDERPLSRAVDALMVALDALECAIEDAVDLEDEAVDDD